MYQCGETLPTETSAELYALGDIVCWDLGGGITHIGVVSAIRTSDKEPYSIVHNISGGQVIVNMLFDFAIIGNYRYLPRL